VASDPYKNFKFKLKWDGKYVAGLSKASGLTRTIETVDFREGGDPCSRRHMPGQSNFEAITLERGLTHDTKFEQWCEKAEDLQKSHSKTNIAPKSFRKDIILDVYNEAGQVVLAYNIYRCWVSEFIALTDLGTGNNAVVIESLVLQNEGWDRDS